MNDNIYKELENFNFPNKNEYNWKILQVKKKSDKENITLFSGELKDDNNKEKPLLYLKKFEIKGCNYDEEELKHIIINLNILYGLKDQDYFPNNISLLSSNFDECIYLIIKENTIPLKNLIALDYKFSYLNNNKLIKWIVYQITFGLYTLHYNKIIHHDLKPSNIFINSKGQISIFGFNSSIIKGEESYEYCLFYAAPELLIDREFNDEKVDMWSLGVIILELYLCQCPFFCKENINDNKAQLKNILNYFDVDENYSEENLKNDLNKDKNIQFQIKKSILDKINDQDAVELINKLLILSPKQRFSAEKVLLSKYLIEFSGINSLDNKPIKFPIDFKTIKDSKIDKNKFVELIKEKIVQK